VFDEGYEIGLVSYAFEEYQTELLINENMDVWLTIKVIEYENQAGNGECNPNANDRHQDSFNCFKQYFQDQLFNQTFGMMTCKENFGNCSIPQVI